MIGSKIDTVLLVDDNPDDLFINRLVVESSCSGCRILEFDYGRDALRALESEGESLGRSIVFLDINMPRMNGFEFVELFGKLPEAVKGDMRIVMLTTSLSQDDKLRADRMGGICRFVQKPLSISGFERLRGELFR